MYKGPTKGVQMTYQRCSRDLPRVFIVQGISRGVRGTYKRGSNDLPMVFRGPSKCVQITYQRGIGGLPRVFKRLTKGVIFMSFHRKPVSNTGLYIHNLGLGVLVHSIPGEKTTNN